MDLTFTFTTNLIGQVSWTPMTGADHYRVCESSTLTFSASCSTLVSGTTHVVAMPPIPNNGKKFVWVTSCDAADVCGPASRSYVTIARQQVSGDVGGYWWAYYKTNTTFGFQASRSSVTTPGLSLHVYAGDANGPLILSTNCIPPGGETQPGGGVIPGVSAPYTVNGDLASAPTLVVARHAGGVDCTDHGVHNTNVSQQLPVRQRPAAPTGLDIFMDMTGTGINLWRTTLEWPDDPNVGWYRYCSSSVNGLTGPFSCPPSIVFRKSFQVFNQPSSPGVPMFYRLAACDVDFYCSSLSTEYIGMLRSTSSGEFTVVYRRNAATVKFLMKNHSWYGIPLWVKLHAQHGTAPEMNVCSRDNPGDGPVSASVEVARDLSASTLNVLRHPIGDFFATTCAAADTTPNDHSGDTSVGALPLGDANYQVP
jgi:hypothetical protein